MITCKNRFPIEWRDSWNFKTQRWSVRDQRLKADFTKKNDFFDFLWWDDSIVFFKTKKFFFQKIIFWTFLMKLVWFYSSFRHWPDSIKKMKIFLDSLMRVFLYVIEGEEFTYRTTFPQKHRALWTNLQIKFFTISGKTK